MPQRDYYIDRLRSVMTVLVIFHHTAITYGAPGGWFWTELKPSGSPTGMLLTLFVTTNQAYFMGFFFLLAGYFTPAALERKGYARFICDRFLRLGLPLLAFGLVLGPLTAAIVNYAEGDGFWVVFGWLWRHRQFINGPLWFAQALLIFSLAYCAWRAAFGRRPGLVQDTHIPAAHTPAAHIPAARAPKPVPSLRWWMLSALVVGLAAVAIRQFVPVGVNVFGLQLGYFATYIFLFAAGIAAWRHDWLSQLTWKSARGAILVAAVAWPLMPLAGLVAARIYGHGNANFGGGLTWPAIFYALWEPCVAWGFIAAWLLLFRARMNAPSAFWAWLNRRAYAVYIVHPVVLVSVALLLHGWVAPALVKFSVVGTLACIGSWLVSDPLVRLPGLRSIV